MGNEVWLARGGSEIAGGEHQIANAVQDEASPAALRCRTPEAQGLLLAELKNVLLRNLPETLDLGSAHPCNGREKALQLQGRSALSKADFD